jgi:predicted AAA+ superfamily ATPase
MHPFCGYIFETRVISELLKGRFNRGLRKNLYFWRDHVGHEVDCIIERWETLIPLEIKSGETVTRDFFKGLNYW